MMESRTEQKRKVEKQWTGQSGGPGAFEKMDA